MSVSTRKQDCPVTQVILQGGASSLEIQHRPTTFGPVIQRGHGRVSDLNAGIGPEKILTRYRGYSSSHWIEKH